MSETDQLKDFGGWE